MFPINKSIIIIITITEKAKMEHQIAAECSVFVDTEGSECSDFFCFSTIFAVQLLHMSPSNVCMDASMFITAAPGQSRIQISKEVEQLSEC